jgi:tryptophan synthase alpha chain
LGRIEQIFTERKKLSKKVNIIYLTPEYPFEGLTVPLVEMIARNNVHIVEIGIPFSDPLADGPTIQHSSFKSLQKGVNIPRIMDFVVEIKKKSTIGIILMTYINPVLAYGISDFATHAKKSGIDGVIIPDLPLEELRNYKRYFSQEGLDLIMLVSPSTPLKRLENIASNSSGFLYCVSLNGVTGVRNSNHIDHETQIFLQQVRSVTKLPLAIGFGLSKYDQLKELADYTDGYIIGSALIKSMEQADNKEEALNVAKSFIQGVFKD